MEVNKIQIIKQFSQQGIFILNTWINEQLISFPNDSYQQVYKKFLDSDLALSCRPLPDDFIHGWGPDTRGKIHKERVFPQGVILQITEILDVSKSLSRQIDIETGVIIEEEFNRDTDQASISSGAKTDFKKKNADKKKQPNNNYNSDFFSGSRTLRLILSDGKNLFMGCEYKSIPSLSVDLALGCKVKVVNPLVLRGILMLESKDIQILGGSISELNCKTTLERLEERLSNQNKNPQPPTRNISSNSVLKRPEKRKNTSNLSIQKRKVTSTSKQEINSNTLSINPVLIDPALISLCEQIILSSDDNMESLDDSDVLFDDDLLHQVNQLNTVNPQLSENIPSTTQSVVEILSSSDSPDKSSQFISKPNTTSIVPDIDLLDEFSSDCDFDAFME